MARGALTQAVAASRTVAAALCLAVILALAGSARPSAAASPVSRLKEEKARLTEMKRKAEAAAAELSETMKREKTVSDKVGDLREKLSRQRRLIARIDRRLSALGDELDRAAAEVSALDEKRGAARRSLSAAAAASFAALKERGGASRDGSPSALDPREERLRHFAKLALGSGAERLSGLTADKEDQEERVASLEQRLESSARAVAREKRVGETLAVQRQAREKELAGIEARKKKKEKELRVLRARVARLETLVSRIEKQVRERDGRRERGAGKSGPSRFSAVPGGMVAPLPGKVVSLFGRQHDPVFDVTIENRGVEIEARSGSAIRSVGRGEVVFTGGVPGFGKVLVVRHGSGLFSVYGKAESFSAGQGKSVTAGEVVGRLPESPEGKSVLYLEIRAGGTAIDPFSVLPLTR